MSRNRKWLRKLVKIYLFVMLLPMLFINGLFAFFSEMNSVREQRKELVSVLERTEYNLKRYIDDAVLLSDYLYNNKEVKEFVQREFLSNEIFYDSYEILMRQEYMNYCYTAQSVYKLSIITDNDTIMEGGGFVKESSVRNEQWFQEFLKSNQQVYLCAYFDVDDFLVYSRRSRMISVLRNMPVTSGRAILKMDIDYEGIVKELENEDPSIHLAIVSKNQMICSNQENEKEREGDFPKLSEFRNLGVKEHRTLNLTGGTWELYATQNWKGFLDQCRAHPVICFLILMFDICFPVLTIVLTGRVFSEREKLEVAKKQAELNALQSQMNPHFMFNTLESIRMNSVLKGEDETEEMLGKFSLLLRQASQWDDDFIQLSEEMSFIKNYLEIQKFRFRDQLEYEISMEEVCKGEKIPKFGILTFVENACIHGLEQNTSVGRIFLKVKKQGNATHIAIEDNGQGMNRSVAQELQERMENAKIEDLNGAKHVGMLNAFIRLKIYYEHNVRVVVESEEGKGTKIEIILSGEGKQ